MEIIMEKFFINLNFTEHKKKLKNYDTVVGEWKLKCDDIGTENDDDDTDNND